jgi:hypothetical protein
MVVRQYCTVPLLLASYAVRIPGLQHRYGRAQHQLARLLLAQRALPLGAAAFPDGI